jgi:hypothetical protein
MPASLGVRSLNYGSPINGDAPLNRGLTAKWQVLPLSPGGATWHDLAGRADAVGTGLQPSTATVGWGATRRPGGFGELRFGGSAFAQALPVTALDSASTFSLTVWARQTTTNVIGYMLSKYAAGSLQVALETWNDNNLYFEIANGAGTYLNLPSYTSFISAGVWFHLVAVFNGAGATNPDKAQLYLNGVPMSVSYTGTLPSVTFAFAPGTPLNIGQYGLAANRWVGAMDDVCVYNRALSASEARGLYLASRQGYRHELTWQPWPPGWAGPAAPVDVSRPVRRSLARFMRRAA